MFDILYVSDCLAFIKQFLKFQRRAKYVWKNVAYTTAIKPNPRLVPPRYNNRIFCILDEKVRNCFEYGKFFFSIWITEIHSEYTY